jgi:hypothetical protein
MKIHSGISAARNMSDIHYECLSGIGNCWKYVIFCKENLEQVEVLFSSEVISHIQKMLKWI